MKMRIIAAFLISMLAVRGADITPGYTFSSGELVTHTKLNTAAAGSINTSFLSGKSSAGSNPNTAWQILLRDTGSDAYKRTTIGDILDHSGLLSARSVLSAPDAADTLLIYDVSATSYKQIAISNLFFLGAPLFSDVVSSNDLIPYFDVSAGTMNAITVSNLIMGATALGDEDGDESILIVTGAGNVRRVKVKELISLATDLQGSGALLGASSVWVLQAGVPRETRVMDFFQGGNLFTTIASSETFGFTDNIQLKRASFQTIKSNIVSAYAVVQDQSSIATNGGGLTNSWGVRRVNTVTTDALGIVTSGPGTTNAFSVAAGTYRYRVVCPGYQVGEHQCMLTNQTAGTVIGLGTMARSGTADNTSSSSEAVGAFTVTGTTVLGVRHRADTLNATDGGGRSNTWGGLNIFVSVELWKLD